MILDDNSDYSLLINALDRISKCEHEIEDATKYQLEELKISDDYICE